MKGKNEQRRLEKAATRKDSKKDRRRRRDRDRSTDPASNGDVDGTLLPPPPLTTADSPGTVPTTGPPPPTLPPALLERVLQFLDPTPDSPDPHGHPLGAIAAVCRHWNACVSTNAAPPHVWRSLLHTEGWPAAAPNGDPRHSYQTHHGARRALRHLSRTSLRTRAPHPSNEPRNRRCNNPTSRSACAHAPLSSAKRDPTGGDAVLLRLLRRDATAVTTDPATDDPPYILAGLVEDASLRLYGTDGRRAPGDPGAARLTRSACVRCIPRGRRRRLIAADADGEYVACLSYEEKEGRYSLDALSIEEDLLCAVGEGCVVDVAAPRDLVAMMREMQGQEDADVTFRAHGVTALGGGLFLVDVLRVGTNDQPLLNGQEQRLLTIYCARQDMVVWSREVPWGMERISFLGVTTAAGDDGKVIVAVTWEERDVPSLLLEIAPVARGGKWEGIADVEKRVSVHVIRTDNRGGLVTEPEAGPEAQQNPDVEEEDNAVTAEESNIVWTHLNIYRESVATALTSTHLVIADYIHKVDTPIRRSVLSFHPLSEDGLRSHLSLDLGHYVYALHSFRGEYLLVLTREYFKDEETFWGILVYVPTQTEIARGVLDRGKGNGCFLWGQYTDGPVLALGDGFVAGLLPDVGAFLVGEVDDPEAFHPPSSVVVVEDGAAGKTRKKKGRQKKTQSKRCGRTKSCY